MYLKSIEIHGFKSFANKILFEFPEGITGIVGPNGSGKSNVADAVRWVLGEQKIKQLRGSKMEDVIFAGTANRKPMGFAYVALTLDNSDHKLKLDFEEVTISRRVFRSGESEYMINGSVCRLRDVQELFYDTGIGKEGYSIIGQGQIDKILQGKPEERREIFDEAVGIVKYKKRKNIALRKLDSERQNIARVKDVLGELNRQVGPLRRQSEAANKYIELRDSLKRYDINLFLFENGEIKSKIRECNEKEEIAAKDLAAARDELENAKLEYEKLSENIRLMDEQINQIKNGLAQGDIVKENMQGRINVLEEQINSAIESESHYNERVATINAAIRETQAEKSNFESEREEIQKALELSMTRSTDQDSKIIEIQNRNEELRLSIERLKEQIIELVKEKGNINARRERLDALMEQIGRRKEELAQDMAKFALDRNAQEEKVRTLTEEYNNAAQNVSELESSIAEKKRELAEADANVAKYNRELGEAKELLVKNEAILESLKNITERYEGYGTSIREVMKLKEHKSGIHGVVADIIKVEKKYEIAIETALGGNIQNIVTDNETTAKEAIAYLKVNKLGRATFLPLKAVTGRGEFKNPDVLDEKGVLGLASTLVQVDEKYEGIARYLLGKIVVAETIDDALYIARKYSYSLIIVTLEGELLNRGGALTGGAFKNKSNLLGRRREIEDLEGMISRLRNKQSDCEKNISFVENRKNLLEKESNDLLAELQERKIFLNTIKINLDQANEKAEEIISGFESIDRETQNIEEQKGNMTSETNTLQIELDDNANKNSEIEKLVLELEESLSSSKTEEAAELIVGQNIKVENSRLTEQNSFLINAVIKAENEIEKLSSELELLERNRISSSKVIESKKTEIEEIKASIGLAETERQELEGRLSCLESEKELQSGSHKGFIDKRESCSEKIAALDKEVFRLSSTREKLEEKFENKSSYIWEQYELTYNSAISLKDATLTDTKEMKENINRLKGEIRSLGVINVAAIEEYKEVSERFDFMTNQYNDLLNAEADLVKIIRDLDKQMREQFNTEFKKINAEFSRVFTEMFGGGHGSIELEEDVDVLDAGISIIAQPPGKKLQNMMQLSGGEKALTAIAVLFAIQNLKPSPFCILDEIEAALDDANIDKFAGYLHKLIDFTQFIVITHRKGTMEAADRLYGITMQEKGVSTLISVNLSDYSEEKLA